MPRSSSDPTGSAPRAPGPGGGRTGNASPQRNLSALLRPPPQPVRYFTAKDPKAIDERLLGEEAEQVAERLATVPASQLRRFYAAATALKRRAEFGSASDEEIRAEMMLLRAKAAYTLARQKSYPDELVSFFTRHAASVRTRQDFLRGFYPHFEAVMAFHKVHEKEKGVAG